MASRLGQYRDRLKEHPLSRVGPGLITGVADDDPSGIATYSQAGAQFGLNMLWTMPLAFPLMARSNPCARASAGSPGKGSPPTSRIAFSPIVLSGVVLLLLIANMLNIAADVAAMGEVAELVTGFDRHLMTAFFVFGTLLLQVFVPYHRYVCLPEMAYRCRCWPMPRCCSRFMFHGARWHCARYGRVSR